MKVKRNKAAKKNLGLYKNGFGLHAPYQVLVDGTFCHAALKCKIHIKESLEKYLSDSVKIYTTNCIVDELRRLGPDFSGTRLLAKRYEYRRCKHDPPVSAKECIQDLMSENNKFRLFIATQDSELRKELRDIPCLPLLFIDYNCILLEPLSEASRSALANKQAGNTTITDTERKFLKLKPVAEKVEQPTKKSKKKNPNSLSCKLPKAEMEALQKERKKIKNQKKNAKRAEKKKQLLEQAEKEKQGDTNAEGVTEKNKETMTIQKPKTKAQKRSADVASSEDDDDDDTPASKKMKAGE